MTESEIRNYIDRMLITHKERLANFQEEKKKNGEDSEINILISMQKEQIEFYIFSLKMLDCLTIFKQLFNEKSDGFLELKEFEDGINGIAFSHDYEYLCKLSKEKVELLKEMLKL